MATLTRVFGRRHALRFLGENGSNDDDAEPTRATTSAGRTLCSISAGLAGGPVDLVAAAMRRSEIQVQHLHSALGESRRRRAAPDGDDRSAEPDVAGSTTLANDGSADSTIARSGFPRVTVSSDRHGARAGLSVVGDLDASAALAFSALVQTLVDEGARSIVVELGAAGVVDADGLQALVGAFEHLEQCGGEMVLRSPRSRTLLAVNPAGLSDVRSIC